MAYFGFCFGIHPRVYSRKPAKYHGFQSYSFCNPLRPLITNVPLNNSLWLHYNKTQKEFLRRLQVVGHSQLWPLWVTYRTHSVSLQLADFRLKIANGNSQEYPQSSMELFIHRFNFSGTEKVTVAPWHCSSVGETSYCFWHPGMHISLKAAGNRWDPYRKASKLPNSSLA